MRIAGAASAFPKYYYSQKQILDAFKRHWNGRLPNPRLLHSLHSSVGVEGRHLVLPIDAYVNLSGFGEANGIWIEAAVELAQQSLCRALTRAGLSPADLDALIFVSITGVASPSIDARLINRMHLPPHIRRVPVFGLGCVAGAAGLSSAAEYVRAFPDRNAAVISVELCSLTLQRDDFSVANLVSSGLFGDGAAAVVVSGNGSEAAGPEIVATGSSFYPDTEGVMGWDISEKGFRIVLSREVPDVVKAHLAGDVDGFLARHGLSRSDIGSWVFHTGGPKVLEAVESSLGLHSNELEASWESLRKIGNLSSASVLVVLDDVIATRRPNSGTWGLLGAMGPGFCSELVLLRW